MLSEAIQDLNRMNESKGTSTKQREREGFESEVEGSLVQLLQLHHLSSASLTIQTEKAKKDAMRWAMRVSDLMVDAVNADVQECFMNEKRIELELRSLSATITRFHKHTSQCLQASHSLNSALKEIGDFENWMKVMEYDCKSITAAIYNIHQM